jgi:hypothetical protein
VIMTAGSTSVAREIEMLEAELRMALSDVSVTAGKRTELEDRLSAIKAKAEGATAEGDASPPAKPKD